MKRLLTLALACALMLACLAVAAPAPAAAETIPMTWKKFDKAYVVFEIDVTDGAEEIETINTFHEIVTEEYGFPLCVSTTTNSMSAGKLAAMRKVEDHGGEITSHTHSGRVLNTYVPWDTVDYEFKTSLDVFKQHGFNVNGIMLMGGGGSSQPDPTKREDTSVEYRTEIEKYTSKYYKYSNYYGVSAQYYNPRVSIKNSPKNYINDAIANKSWVSIFTHGLNDDGYPEGLLRYVLDYLKQKEQAGELEVVTYKYIYENLANWQKPVDLGDTKYTVDFYSTDKKTLLGSSVVIEGKAATAPELNVKDGFTFTGWSTSFNKVTDNLMVYAQCIKADGTPVKETDASPLTAKADHTSHTWGKTYTSSANGHQRTCTVCGEPEAVQAHKPGKEMANGKQICTVCRYVIKKGDDSTTQTTDGNGTTTAPDTSKPDSGPIASNPDSSAPDASKPAVPAPDVSEPDSNPIASNPHSSAPDVSEPDSDPIASNPNSSAPDVSEPDSDPIASNPDSSAPDVSAPDTSEPDSDPIASNPDSSAPDAPEVDTEPTVDNNGDILTYVLIGVVAVVAIAAVIVGILLAKKKKATSPTE